MRQLPSEKQHQWQESQEDYATDESAEITQTIRIVSLIEFDTFKQTFKKVKYAVYTKEIKIDLTSLQMYFIVHGTVCYECPENTAHFLQQCCIYIYI